MKVGEEVPANVVQVPDHYSVLGLSRQASQADVRMAYFRCMKACHPDRHPTQDSVGKASRLDARVVNEAYSVLKDRHKRKTYDSILARSATLTGSMENQYPGLAKAKSRSVPRSNVGLMIVVLAMSSFAMVLLRAFEADSNGPSMIQSVLFGSPILGDRFAASQVTFDSGLRKAIEVATAVSARDAVAKSTSCFDDARAHPDLQRIDACVAFDSAYSYWHEGEPPWQRRTTYFDDGNVEARDLRALSGLGPEYARMRLESLRNLTFSIMLKQANELAKAENQKAEQSKAEFDDPEGSGPNARIPPTLPSSGRAPNDRSISTPTGTIY